MIEIVPCDSNWPARFTAEAARIDTAMAGAALRIENVGSTSVPGLAAEHGGATPESRERYSLSKTEFVRSVLERACPTHQR
jgi:hypothetical protein